MKKLVVPALAALFALNAGAAFAWSDVTGVIKSLDSKTHEFTLDNGKIYSADSTVNFATFKMGDKVTITTEAQNGKNIVNKVVKAS